MKPYLRRGTDRGKYSAKPLTGMIPYSLLNCNVETQLRSSSFYPTKQTGSIVNNMLMATDRFFQRVLVRDATSTANGFLLKYVVAQVDKL